MAKHIFLYHGSDVKIPNPKWNVGSDGLDFGKCFYTTYSLEIAKDWTVKKSPNNPQVTQYAINLEKLASGDLKIKHFEADEEWAEFVYQNRQNEKYKRPNYDIIIGPIADKGLKQYFADIKMKKLSFAEMAKRIAYDQYKAIQVCFCSDYSIAILNPQC